MKNTLVSNAALKTTSETSAQALKHGAPLGPAVAQLSAMELG